MADVKHPEDYVFFVIPGSHYLPSVNSPTGEGELLVKNRQVEEMQAKYPTGYVRELLEPERKRLNLS